MTERKKPLEPRECDWCHKMFVPRTKNQRYCGSIDGRISRCARNGQRRDWKIKHGLTVMSIKELECPICHKEFVPKRANQKYCCSDCQRQAHLKKIHPEGPMTKQCDWCDNTFMTYDSRRKYCTDSCKQMAQENEKSLSFLSKDEREKKCTLKKEHVEKIKISCQTGLSYGIVSSLWPDKKAIYQRAVYKMQVNGNG